MKIRKLPPTKYLHECFLYQKATGKLFWKKRPRKHFATTAAFKMWNKRWPGKEAFYTSGRGYRFGNLNHQYCAAHRVIWKLKTGKEPPDLIDHRDRNKGNNRWRNLRAATKSQNCVNHDRPIGPSGFRGVHKHRNKDRWVAQIGTRSEKRYLGIFDSPDKAGAARRAAEKASYGEFAP